MAGNLTTRLDRLEAQAFLSDPKPRQVVRIVCNAGEEAEAYRQAEEMGLDTSPESNDILIIRLIGVAPQRDLTQAVDRLEGDEIQVL